MAFRFFRRTKIAPGLSLNLSKRGASVSAGPRGAKITAGTRGTRRTVGLPGTGMYWYEQSGYGRGGGKRRSGRGSGASGGAPRGGTAAAAEPQSRPEERLTLGFFQRLITPKHEEAFVDGMRQLVRGDDRAALRQLRKATHLADGAFAAGLVALKLDRPDEAERHLTQAKARHAGLGRHFDKYGLAASAELRITEQVAAHVEADTRGILLALAEAHQRQGRWRDAVGDLKKLYAKDPDDAAVRLSLAELLVEEAGGTRAAKQVVRLAEGVENESPVHAGILLYKGKALATLGLHTAARDAFTAALRRKKDRPAELLREARYERALAYAALGRQKRSRSELEKVYADDPDFEDVAERLGVG